MKYLLVTVSIQGEIVRHWTAITAYEADSILHLLRELSETTFVLHRRNKQHTIQSGWTIFTSLLPPPLRTLPIATLHDMLGKEISEMMLIDSESTSFTSLLNLTKEIRRIEQHDC